jgi:MYXO-CTERM domain-containing protein
MRASVTSARVLAAALLVGASAHATIDDDNFTESEPFTAVDTPTGLGFPPDGSNRLFVIGRDGDIRIVENGTLLSTPFATVSPLYRGSNEVGLIGMAFDPDFGTNGFLYVFATVSSSEQQIIRYRANGNVGTDKTTIVSGLPTTGNNHNGGAIAFGPDGKLYWAIGNNGGDNLGTNDDLTLLASKVSRANRDGTLPDGNPFDDGNGPNNDFIWARGFRNPFTMAFDPETERLWLNVVGDFHEQIFIVGAGDHGGYSDYENDQPASFISPIISYRTDGTDAVNIAANGAVRAGGTTTFTTSAAHVLRVGAQVTIAGVSNTSFNGTTFVTAVPSATSFRIAQTGADATSGGGSATTANIGACVTGGVFYDTTAAGDAYRGNFFFGDYSTGALMRVRRNGSTVTSVERFGTVNGAVDMALGPEGDLYYISVYQDIIYRARYNGTAQGIVVTPTNVRMVETGVAAINVRLAAAPSSAVSVSVARASGDSDVTVSAGATLNFTTSNWATPQVVRLAAAEDADMDHDSAVLDVSASGLTTRNVTVRVTDPWEGSTGGTGGTGGSGTGGGATGGGSGAAGSSGTGDGGAEDGGAPAGGTAGDGGSAQGGSARGGSTQGGASSGASGAGGGKSSSDSKDSSGCGCRTGHVSGSGAWLGLVLAWLLVRRRRSR